jgi:membrane associated rhomboid family serine protease
MSVETHRVNPSESDVRAWIEGELSSRARFGYTIALLLDLIVGAVIASLLLTEPSLPGRTRIAFGVMLAIAAAWAAFFGWTLTRRTLFPAWHRVVAARLAVAFTSVFVLGALALALVAPDMRQTSLAAAAAGGVLLGMAAVILVRARRQHRTLLSRKEQLEREVADEHQEV